MEIRKLRTGFDSATLHIMRFTFQVAATTYSRKLRSNSKSGGNATDNDWVPWSGLCSDRLGEFGEDL